MASSIGNRIRYGATTAWAVGLPLLLGGWSFALQDYTPSGISACPSSGEISVGELGAIAHVRFLADDALRGREVGTQGARCAGDYPGTPAGATSENAASARIYPLDLPLPLLG